MVGTACATRNMPSYNCNLKMGTTNTSRIMCYKRHLPQHIMCTCNVYSTYNIRTCQQRFPRLSFKPNPPHKVASLSSQIMPFHFWSTFSSTPSEAGSKGGRPNSASDPDLGTYRRIAWELMPRSVWHPTPPPSISETYHIQLDQGYYCRKYLKKNKKKTRWEKVPLYLKIVGSD